MWCPLTLEFEIVSGATDAVVTPFTMGEFNGNASTSWQIEDVRLIDDIVTLDNGLQHSYDEHVLASKTLPINDNTYVTRFTKMRISKY